jgi:predicted metalloprotease
MSFNPKSGLDAGQVRDVRGRSPGGRGLAVGGGGIGLVIVIAYLLLGGDPSALLGPGGAGPATGPESSTLAQECKTGADANARADCRIVGYVNSVQEYWTGALAGGRVPYRPAQTVIFSGSIQTGCGGATSQVGPFYCPADGNVYLDLGFFDDLQARFGARGGRFAEAYVVAHEYGHHLQNLLGILGQRSNETGATSDAVRTELMADCLAGVWANNAEATKVIADVNADDISDALDAASAVGDDRIQAKTQGQVNPESWTHGSAEQRRKWFTTGYRQGDIEACDTFAVSNP